VSWAWWDWPFTWLINHRHRPSVLLWRCWLGHMTRKIVLKWPIMCRLGRWILLYHTIPYSGIKWYHFQPRSVTPNLGPGPNVMDFWRISCIITDLSPVVNRVRVSQLLITLIVRCPSSKRNNCCKLAFYRSDDILLASANFLVKGEELQGCVRSSAMT